MILEILGHLVEALGELADLVTARDALHPRLEITAGDLVHLGAQPSNGPRDTTRHEPDAGNDQQEGHRQRHSRLRHAGGDARQRFVLGHHGRQRPTRRRDGGEEDPLAAFESLPAVQGLDPRFAGDDAVCHPGHVRAIELLGRLEDRLAHDP